MNAEEQGAFLVADPEGRLRLLWWHSHQHLKATYRGAIPSRAIAIVHTHPYWTPEPSAQDRAEAKRLGLPVITVSLVAVDVANPDATVTRLVKGAGWSRRAMQRSVRRSAR